MQAQTPQPGSEPAAFTHDAALRALPPAAVRLAPPIVALSDDAMLLEGLTMAAVDQARVSVCPSADRFVDQLMATTPELALVDAGAVTDLPALLDTLHRQFPQLQLLVAGPGNVQHQIARQLGDGTVFRFAHKPASAARLRLFIEAALRARQTRITAEILNTPAPAAPRTDRIHSSASRSRGLIVAAIMALVCAAAGYWYQAAPIVPMPRARKAAVPREADAAAEQAAIDQSSAQRSQRDEQESHAEQARRAAQDATLQPLKLQPLQLQPLQLLPLQLQALELPSADDPPAAAEPPVTPAVTATGAIVDESSLQRVDFISPRYPLEALRLGVTGDVEMDFTVTPTGDVADVEVTFALPAGVFEATSIEALSHSRYQPVQRDGVNVAQRAHIHMRYEL